MHWKRTLIPISLLLAGCGNSDSTAKNGPVAPTTPVARLATVPMSTAAATPNGGFPTAYAHQHIKLPTIAAMTVMTPTPFPASAYSAVIQGRITSSGSGRPLSGAVVAVNGTNHKVTTDASGRYRLAFPAGPSVPLTVTRTGYFQAVSMGSIQPNRAYKLNFSLVPKSKSSAPPAPSFFGSH